MDKVTLKYVCIRWLVTSKTLYYHHVLQFIYSSALQYLMELNNILQKEIALYLLARAIKYQSETYENSKQIHYKEKKNFVSFSLVYVNVFQYQKQTLLKINFLMLKQNQYESLGNNLNWNSENVIHIKCDGFAILYLDVKPK